MKLASERVEEAPASPAPDAPRQPLPRDSRPSRLSFIGFSCTLPDGSTTRLSAHVDVLDGDVQSAIDIVRRAGGLLVPADDDPAIQYFLPWPCALVQIVALPVGNDMMQPA